MMYLWLALFTAAAAGADQLAKYLVVRNIPLGAQIPVLPGVVHLTHVRNTGAAFSMLSGQTWVFFAATGAFFLLAAVAVTRKWLKGNAQLWAAAAVCGGALGNLIDRLTNAYVVDMIEVEFMHFAVFNVADCFITVGAVVLVLAVLLEGKKGHASRSGS